MFHNGSSSVLPVLKTILMSATEDCVYPPMFGFRFYYYYYYIGCMATTRHENCLEHGQHAGGTIMKHLRNLIMGFNVITLRLPQ